MKAKIQVPKIPEEEKTPIVLQLLEICEQHSVIIHQQAEIIQQLKDEIACLKNQKPKPRIRPSQLEKRADKEESPSEKRPGSEKKSKTVDLVICETIRISPESIPPGSIFKGCQEYTVQDIVIKPHNIRNFSISSGNDQKKLDKLGGVCYKYDA